MVTKRKYSVLQLKNLIKAMTKDKELEEISSEFLRGNSGLHKHRSAMLELATAHSPVTNQNG